jgi:DUF4097 and DUF4098 domain-containing protein YvlB
VTGNIDVSDCEADEFNVNTMSGNVTIRKLKGRRLDLHTTMGNARLQEITIDRAIVQSMAGNLEFAGRLARSGRYQFQTHGGNIQVIPSGNPGFDLEATTYSGDVRSDFELKVTEPPASARQRQPRSLRGTFGNAGAVLTASSFSGNIDVTKP